MREWGSHYLVSLTYFGTTLYVFEVYPVVYKAVLVEFRIACLCNTLAAGRIKHLGWHGTMLENRFRRKCIARTDWQKAWTRYYIVDLSDSGSGRGPREMTSRGGLE